ncbi:MAG: hypothetical protein Q9209_007736 [Squamulea sp. 1 TL-2023]
MDIFRMAAGLPPLWVFQVVEDLAQKSKAPSCPENRLPTIPLLPTNITGCIGSICLTILEVSLDEGNIKKTLQFRLAPPFGWIVGFFIVLLIVTSLRQCYRIMCGLARGIRAWFTEVRQSRKTMTEDKLSTKEKPSVIALPLTNEEPLTTVGDDAKPASIILSTSLPTTGHYNVLKSHASEGTSAIGDDTDIPAHEDVSKLSMIRTFDTSDEAADGEENSKTGYEPVKHAWSRRGLEYPSTKAGTGVSENADSAAVETNMIDKDGFTSISTEPSPNELVFARHAPDLGPTRYVLLPESMGDDPAQGTNGDAVVQEPEKPT